jgi:ribose transport system ATP-binding protein
MQAASTPSQSDAVAVERVTKRFGATLALDEASLHVRSGTVHALLGGTVPASRRW